MPEPTIILSTFDRTRLQRLLETAGDRPDLDALRDEIDRAEIVEPASVPDDRVTMNSRIRFRREGSANTSEVTLVFPAEADVEKNRVSVLAPVGSALLGLRVGDSIEWPLPGSRTARLTVEAIVYQPEAAGDPI